MMNMSDRIRQRRKELNLTQQALADLTGVLVNKNQNILSFLNQGERYQRL